MKSLKKTLSLVLVLVMVLGMFGIASATNYVDDADIQYKEAVDVMTGLGAIEGYTNDANAGKFLPKGTITRAEAAKMATYTLIGPTAAAALVGVTSRYTDMGNDKWAIPYVEYLSSVGAVEGVGNNKFNPKGNVTGYEYGKILLAGLGYGANGEYSGSDWVLNVAIDANKTGVGIYADRVAGASALSAAATREECALYSFNALFADMVRYTALIGYIPLSTNLAWSVYDLDISSSLTADAFGRPANVWVKNISNPSKAKAIASVASTPVYSTYTTATSAAAQLAVRNAGASLPTAATITVYKNGTAMGTLQTATAAFSQAFSGTMANYNGTKFEVYADPTTGVVNRVVIIETELLLVNSLTKDNAATTNIDERTINVGTFKAYPKNNGNVSIPEAVGFEAAYTAAAATIAAGKDAYLLVVKLPGNVIYSVAVPTTATLTPTAYTSNVGFNVGTTAYYYSAKMDFTKQVTANGTPVTVTYDSYGFVIACDQVAGVTGIAFVTAVGYTQSGISQIPAAELLYADGTTETVPLIDGATPSTYKDTIVIYSVVNGRYDLTVAVTATPNGSLSISNGVSKFSWAGIDYSATAKTVFFVRTGTPGAYTYSAYVGASAVPSMTGTVSGAIAATSGIATAVFLDNPLNSSTTTDLVFVSKLPSLSGAIGTTSYYAATVLVNGESKDLLLAAAYPVGVYTAMTTAANGITTLAGGKVPTATTPIGNTSGLLTVSATTQILAASNIAVYFYDANGVIVAGRLSDIPDLTTPKSAEFTYATNAAGTQVTALFIKTTITDGVANVAAAFTTIP